MKNVKTGVCKAYTLDVEHFVFKVCNRNSLGVATHLK